MTSETSFPLPEPKKTRTRIWPVFLPFQGCPGKCIYCAQDVQTGTREGSLSASYAQLQARLQEGAAQEAGPLEIAFYGGTFTSLPWPWPLKFLSLATRYRQKGLVTRIRCSTRPDAVEENTLRTMRANGLDLVELGVQSFSDPVLVRSQRSYTGADAQRGCAAVSNSGLGLGIQLLPGLPGHDQEAWFADIARAIRQNPAFIRIYPCLVLRGTKLERLYRQGRYAPWSLEKTVAYLSRGVFRLWRAGIPVTRIGLPPEPAMIDNLIAGPWHPALGSMVRSRILFARLLIQASVLGPGAKRAVCPRRVQGELFGQRGRYLTRLRSIGIDPGEIRFQEQDRFLLQKTQQATEPSADEKQSSFPAQGIQSREDHDHGQGQAGAHRRSADRGRRHCSGDHHLQAAEKRALSSA